MLLLNCRHGYSEAQEVQGVMGPSAHAHCASHSACDPDAQLAPSVLGLLVGAGLNNISSPYLSEPVLHVAFEDVLGTRALDWH